MVNLTKLHQLSPTFISCQCDTGDIAGGCVRFASAHESTKIHQQPMGKLMLWGPLGFLDEIPFLPTNHAPNKNGCISNTIVAFQILLAIFHWIVIGTEKEYTKFRSSNKNSEKKNVLTKTKKINIWSRQFPKSSFVGNATISSRKSDLTCSQLNAQNQKPIASKSKICSLLVTKKSNVIFPKGIRIKNH